MSSPLSTTTPATDSVYVPVCGGELWHTGYLVDSLRTQGATVRAAAKHPADDTPADRERQLGGCPDAP